MCPALVSGRGSRCEAHRKAEQRTYNARRPKGPRGFYGGAWRKLRAHVLRGEPLCRQCRQSGRIVQATDVDHIVPRSLGGSDEVENLQPLCGSCHARKTATEDGGFGNRIRNSEL